MAIAIRGTTPATAATTSNPISLTLTGARQPQTGDVLLIIHGNDYYALSDMPTPTVGGSTTGVNPVTNGAADGGSLFAHAKSYTFVVGSTGDLTVSVTEGGLADEEKCLVVYVFSGADTSTPIDVAANDFANTGSTSKVAPSVSPSSSDAYLVCHTNDGNGSNSVSYTPPGGMAEQYDASLGAAMGYSGATLQLVSSGATGTKTFTSPGGSNYCVLSIAVKTAGGGAGAADLGFPNWLGPAPGLGMPNSDPQPWLGTDATVASDAAPTAEATSGTGAAFDATVDIQANAGNAAGSGAANSASIDAAVNAEAASGSGAGQTPAADLAVPAGLASGTAAAQDPQTAGAGQPPEAAATGAALAAAVDIQVGAGLASGTGAASDATVSTSSNVNAAAELASGTGSAPDPAADIAVPAGLASGSAAAFDVQISVGVLADVAGATGTAYQPTVTGPVLSGIQATIGDLDPTIAGGQIVSPTLPAVTGTVH